MFWEEVKKFPRTEFAVDRNLDRAWKELKAEKFDWEDSPQGFTNRLICRYAILETKFYKKKLPNRDRLVKK